MIPKCDHCPVAGDHCPAFAPTCDAIRCDAEKRAIFLDLVAQYGIGPCVQAEPEYPPLPEQVGNLARSFWDWAMGGFEMTSGEEQARRLAICRGCQWFEAQSEKCHVCGCAMQLKTRLATSHCPLPAPKW